MIERDQKTKMEVELVIKNQLSEAEKIKQSNFVIYNNIISVTEIKVKEIHDKILEMISNS